MHQNSLSTTWFRLRLPLDTPKAELGAPIRSRSLASCRSFFGASALLTSAATDIRMRLLVLFDRGEFSGRGFGGDNGGVEAPLAVRFDDLRVISSGSHF